MSAEFHTVKFSLRSYFGCRPQVSSFELSVSSFELDEFFELVYKKYKKQKVMATEEQKMIQGFIITVEGS